MAITRANFEFGSSEASTGIVAATAFAATTGNLIVVFLRAANNDIHLSTINDTAGNNYLTIGGDESADPRMMSFYAKNIMGHATNIVTATIVPFEPFVWVAAVEYTGADQTDPLDQHDEHDNPAGPNLVTAAITTTAADEVIVVATSQPEFTTYSAGATMTLIEGAIGIGNFFGGIEEKIVSSLQSGVVYPMTSGGNSRGLMMTATFKAASAAVNEAGAYTLLLPRSRMREW